MTVSCLTSALEPGPHVAVQKRSCSLLRSRSASRRSFVPANLASRKAVVCTNAISWRGNKSSDMSIPLC